MNNLPNFSLPTAGATRTQNAYSFPSGRPTLICFVKEDCPTTRIAMPLLQKAHEVFGENIDVVALAQNGEDDLVLAQEYGLEMPLLDDSNLTTSFAYDIETVPTLILASSDGTPLTDFVGFGRDDWRDLYVQMSAITEQSPPEVDWNSYPESRPGCGSKSLEPGIFERLQAESEGSPIRARRVEIGVHDDVHEFLYEQGLTDGLPVIPPTPERVIRILEGTKRDPQETVAVVPPNLAPVTVEKIAINSVMAGCKPEYLPVVIAAVEAVCTEEFNAHGVGATTMGATPVPIVNGPIRQEIGMNMGLNALGQGNRANAAIGRALRLVLRNVGGQRPGETERSTLGSPLRYTTCFAEWEEISPWAPLHVERGFDKDESVVTAFAMTGLGHAIDQTSRDAKSLVGSIGAKMEAIHHPNSHNYGDAILVLCPEHVETISANNWSKAEIRDRIQDISSRPARELLRNDEIGAGLDPNIFDGPSDPKLDSLIPKFRSTENIHIVVAGSKAGKFSSVFDGWASGTGGSMPTSKKIRL